MGGTEEQTSGNSPMFPTGHWLFGDTAQKGVCYYADLCPNTSLLKVDSRPILELPRICQGKTRFWFLSTRPILKLKENKLFLWKKHCRIDGFSSRVRVGRGHNWGQWNTWAGAIRPKPPLTPKKLSVTDGQTDRRTDRKAGCKVA